MTLTEWQERFQTEEACEDYLFQWRWPKGFVCPKCKGSAYWTVHVGQRKGKRLYECKACGHQTSVTAGTVFQHSKLPLRYWFWAIFLVAQDKGGISALTLKRLLNISYRAAWLMLHKIRAAMLERDSQYKLAGLVQLDDAYVGGVAHGRAGRGTTQTPVVVGLELGPRRHPRYVFVEPVPDLRAESVETVVKEHVERYGIWETDGATVFVRIAKAMEAEHRVTLSEEGIESGRFSWIHTFVSNLKAFLQGTYHGRVRKYLRLYVKEFEWRFNRRRYGRAIYERLLVALVTCGPRPLRQIRSFADVLS